LALKFFYALPSETRADGSPIRPFLDVECLNDGEEWEAGFLNGLESAAQLLLLISEDGIKGIEGAHEHQDNVLLEYEYALEKHEKGQAMILPLMVGKVVEGGLYKPFGAFGVSQYSELKHHSDKSDKSIRGTMEKLFKIQGLKTNPDSFQEKIRDVVKKTDEAVRTLGRMGEAKHAVTFKDKPASEWKVEDVQDWLKNVGLEEFLSNFKENAVDGSTLVDLTEEDLTKELKVTKKLHLQKIMKFITKLKEDETASSGESSEGSSEGDGKVVLTGAPGSVWAVSVNVWSLNTLTGAYKKIEGSDWSKTCAAWGYKGNGYLVCTGAIYQVTPEGVYTKWQSEDWSKTIQAARCGPEHVLIITESGAVYNMNCNDGKYTTAADSWGSTTCMVSYKDGVVVFCGKAYTMDGEGKYKEIGDSDWSQTTAACVCGDTIVVICGDGLYGLTVDGAFKTIASSGWSGVKALTSLGTDKFLGIGTSLWVTDMSGNYTVLASDDWSKTLRAFSP